MRRRRIAVAVAGAGAGAGLATLEAKRRRGLQALNADPLWAELNRPLAGRVGEVRSRDGTRLHVEVFGPDSAPTIILLHGWCEALRLWHHQIRDLSRHHRVVTYDQRGHGRSGSPAGHAYDDASLAEDLTAVLEQCVPAGARFVIAGHSLGAMAIVAWAGRNPEVAARRVAAAALINTGINELVGRSTILGEWVAQRGNRHLLPRSFTLEVTLPTRLDPVSLAIVRRLAFQRDARKADVAFAHQMFTTAPAATRVGFARLLLTLDLTASLRSLSAPTIVISGDSDRLTPPWHAEQLAGALPDCVEHARLERVGHMAMLESPDAVTGRLRRVAGDHATALQPAQAG